MNKRRRKKRRSRTRESLLLAGVTSVAGILVLIMTVAFLKPASPPVPGSSPDAATELPDAGGSGSGTSGTLAANDGTASGGTSTGVSGQQPSDVLVTTGNIHTGDSSSGTGMSNTAGTIQSDGLQGQTAQEGQTASAVLQGQVSQQTTDGQAGQQTAQGQTNLPGQTTLQGQTSQTAGQVAQQGQATQQGQVLPGQTVQQGASWQTGQQIQPSGQETGDGIIPGTLLPADSSTGYGTQGQTASGYGTTDQSGYQGAATQTTPTAVLMSPDNYELVVASAYVNIRNLPSLDSLILSVLAEGGAILRDDNTGGWSRVYFNGRTAYIYSKYLIPIR